MINPKLLEKFSLNLKPESILDWWGDSSREFYNLDYLKFHLDQINEDYFYNRIDENERDLLTALFVFENIISPLHKIYDLEDSSQLLEKYCTDRMNENYIKLHKLVSKSTPFGLLDIIKKSETYKSKMISGGFEDVKKWESKYLMEYFSDDIIKTRIAYYKGLVDELPENTQAILEIIDWLKNSQD